ncbi:hypothetical protein ACOSP7_003938 [Xanthoceras sorbifolium]
MQGYFEVEVAEVKVILEGFKLSKLRFDPLLVESDALIVINLCVGKLKSRCEVDNKPGTMMVTCNYCSKEFK